MTYLKNLTRGAAVGTMGLLLLAATPALAADNPQVAAEVMALARAQWASEIANQPMARATLKRKVAVHRHLLGVPTNRPARRRNAAQVR